MLAEWNQDVRHISKEESMYWEENLKWNMEGKYLWEEEPVRLKITDRSMTDVSRINQTHAPY